MHGSISYNCKMICSSALLISLFLWSTSALHERYVKPDNPSSLICPGQPCLTLDQYTQQAATYFTTGSTFLFLPGNHSLQATINLTNIYDLKFKRSEEKGSTIHGNRGAILCVGVINLTIDGLTLKTTHFEVSESTGIVISDSTFLGNGNLTENSRSTLICINSDITVINCHFEGNTAHYNGGAINIEVSNLDIINSTFNRNMAYHSGGAIYALSGNITVRENLMYDFNDSETAVNIFSRNLASDGGGFQNSRSTSLFSGNFARWSGGAIYTNYGAIKYRNATFVNNSANLTGGAMYGSRTDIEFHDNIIFSHNSAYLGGGMYFIDLSLTIKSGMTLNTSFNNASRYGGAIYYEDTSTQYQCSVYYYYDNIKLPHCFIQLIGTELTGNTSMAIHSYYNTAGVDGSFMYGGNLDRCQLKSDGRIDYSTDSIPSKYNVILQTNNSINDISSYPYHLCYCRSDFSIKFCDRFMYISICRGQKFRVSLFAIAQAGSHVVTTVTARMSHDNARLESNQTYQKLSQQHNCSSLVYNLYSTENDERLTFHPDGPCSREYLSLHVTFLPCPPGFTQSNDKCLCEERLMKYATTCTIDEDGIISIFQNNGSKFWINASYKNGTYHGLIICETCPVEYCKTDTIAISLNNSDMQCALNRSGVLCGACVTNYSFMLGSSRCHVCPNTYLALLLPFAAAGITLVVFLSILRLTVATGMINSVILYANIVQVNRHLFFPINTVNVLTVFIAWMNLDLQWNDCICTNLASVCFPHLYLDLDYLDYNHQQILC